MDKYKATWVSHSSISDFLACPRAYYLRNVYKDPITSHKITITTPALSLGSVVHEVIESLSILPSDQRFKIPLVKKFEEAWLKVSGEAGGFKSKSEEDEYKNRGMEMVLRVQKNPGLLLKKAIKIKSDFIPNFYLSEEDEIILCGKIDWIEYLDQSDSIHLIDFKTGKNEEGKESLQLPIYYLLASNLQTRLVTKVSYWYLNKDIKPVEKDLPDYEKSKENILTIARRIKLARQLNHFKCPKNGCIKCKPLERVLRGEGKKVAVSDTNQDVYILV